MHGYYFVHEHYVFQDAKYVRREKLEENCELQRTDNVQGQIYEHILHQI